MTICPNCGSFVGCECKRCGHKWMPRIFKGELIEPNVCPSCKSPYWNKMKQQEITKLALPSMDIRQKESEQEEALKNKPKFGRFGRK